MNPSFRSSGDLVIFYGKEDLGSCRRIDFSSVNEDYLKHLSDTCDKATFGRAQQDVYDETYRKAGKLDTAYFATKLDVERSGLMNAIRYDLLEGHDCNRSMKVELYKLNVYGKDPFFKSHKDTPHSTAMFGSLVVILPTPHEGGALTFRHHNKEWQFDSAKALSESSDPHLHIAYAAFFGDVEHAVNIVESGYRVTLTYNLYYDDNAVFQVAKTLPANQSLVGQTLEILLSDKTFLPNGGYIGFGLRHEYPIELKPKDTETLEFLEQNLKGSDAMVMQACKDLNLKASLQICYDGDSYCTDEILVTQEADINGRRLYDDRPLGDYLTNEYSAKVIKRCRDCIYECNIETDFEVLWVTERTRFNIVEAVFAANGNEVSAEHVYGSFCLIVQIGPPTERGRGEMQ
ncbi:hypothetical protein ACEPAI_9057 [Sanghuangporus weigelae]